MPRPEYPPSGGARCGAFTGTAAATKMRSSTLLTLCLCGYAAGFTSRTPRPTIARHRLAAMRSTAPLICSESGEAVDDTDDVVNHTPLLGLTR